MIAFLTLELAGVPLWALGLLVNLVASVALVLALFIETRPMSRLRFAGVVAALTLAAAIAGSVITILYGLVYWIEAQAWRDLSGQRTAARRIH